MSSNRPKSSAVLADFAEKIRHFKQALAVLIKDPVLNEEGQYDVVKIDGQSSKSLLRAMWNLLVRFQEFLSKMHDPLYFTTFKLTILIKDGIRLLRPVFKNGFKRDEDMVRLMMMIMECLDFVYDRERKQSRADVFIPIANDFRKAVKVDFIFAVIRPFLKNLPENFSVDSYLDGNNRGRFSLNHDIQWVYGYFKDQLDCYEREQIKQEEIYLLDEEIIWQAPTFVRSFFPNASTEISSDDESTPEDNGEVVLEKEVYSEDESGERASDEEGYLLNTEFFDNLDNLGDWKRKIENSIPTSAAECDQWLAENEKYKAEVADKVADFRLQVRQVQQDLLDESAESERQYESKNVALIGSAVVLNEMRERLTQENEKRRELNSFVERYNKIVSNVRANNTFSINEKIETKLNRELPVRELQNILGKTALSYDSWSENSKEYFQALLRDETKRAESIVAELTPQEKNQTDHLGQLAGELDKLRQDVEETKAAMNGLEALKVSVEDKIKAFEIESTTIASLLEATKTAININTKAKNDAKTEQFAGCANRLHAYLTRRHERNKFLDFMQGITENISRFFGGNYKSERTERKKFVDKICRRMAKLLVAPADRYDASNQKLSQAISYGISYFKPHVKNTEKTSVEYRDNTLQGCLADISKQLKSVI